MSEMTPTIYVINRTADADRLARFAATAAEHDADFERITALDGHDPLAPFFLYRDLLGDVFWGSDQIKPGAFACYLSHAAAWRRLLASDSEMALICEDDVVFTRPPMELSQLVSEDFDVVFANQRAVDWRRAADIDGADLAPVGDVLNRLSEQSHTPGDTIPKAPGGDCYLISRQGAEKLLNYLAEDKIIAGVDWMMIRRSAGAGGLGGEEWAYLASAVPDGDLRAFIIAEAIAGQTDGPSVISHKVQIPIAELRDQRAVGGDLALNRAPSGDQMDPVFAAFDQGDLYEAPALELMRRWMQEGGVYIDIGAHVGNHILFMLRHGGAGRAIPMEFNPRAIKLMAEMIDANDLGDRVDQDHLGFGLAEERGKREAFGSNKNLSNNRLREGFVEKVKTRPGDAMLREIEVDMIKIDVGGDEREVLKGLRKTMKRKRPVLAIDLTRPKSQKALPLIGRLGYVERERAEWADAEGDRIFAIFTSQKAATDASSEEAETPIAN